MSKIRLLCLILAGATALALLSAVGALSAPPEPKKKVSSYMPVVIDEDFSAVVTRMKAAKAGIEARQKALLDERYDLSNRPAKGVTMSRGKPVQEGVRVKLPAGTTWEQLAEMTPDQIRAKNVFPAGFFPLPHPNHPAGGMVFPQHQIKQIKRLERFDLDFDLPEHFLPEFPPQDD